MNDVTRRCQGEDERKRERDGQPYFGGRGDMIQHQRSNRPALSRIAGTLLSNLLRTPHANKARLRLSTRGLWPAPHGVPSFVFGWLQFRVVLDTLSDQGLSSVSPKPYRSNNSCLPAL